MNTTTLQANVADAQALLYRQTLVRLMQRSGDNTELVNALRDFHFILDIMSCRGQLDQPLTSGHVIRLTEFFKDQTRALKNTV